MLIHVSHSHEGSCNYVLHQASWRGTFGIAVWYTFGSIFFGSLREFYDAALRTLFLKLSLDYFGVIIPLEVAWQT